MSPECLWSSVCFETTGKHEIPGSYWESYCLNVFFCLFFFKENFPEKYWSNEDRLNGRTVSVERRQNTHCLVSLHTPVTLSGQSIASRGTMKMDLLSLFGIQKQGLELEPDNYPRLFRLHGTRANWKHTHTQKHEAIIIIQTKSTHIVGCGCKTFFFLLTQIKTCLRKINTLVILCKNE